MGVVEKHAEVVRRCGCGRAARRHDVGGSPRCSRGDMGSEGSIARCGRGIRRIGGGDGDGAVQL